ncbi:MAG TPA: ATPase [Armatimonadetes bacterium]|nr:ATPase [Armatimonadota bacterium]
MEIRNLLKQLEEHIDQSRGIGHWRWVDEQKIAVILRRIEVALPNELQRAEEITRERDKYLRAARDEAERIIREADEERKRILERAQREAERMISESEIMRQAEQRAEELLRRAEQMAQEQRIAANEYAQQVLDKLERVADRIKEAIQIGRHELEVEAEENREMR